MTLGVQGRVLLSYRILGEEYEAEADKTPHVIAKWATQVSSYFPREPYVPFKEFSAAEQFNPIIKQRAAGGEPIENTAALYRKVLEEYTHLQSNGLASKA